MDMKGMDEQGLRGFLRMVERDHPQELLRIKAPVKADRDITSLVFELENAGRSPVVVYENVEGYSMPVVTNIAGNRRLLAACLGVSPADLPTHSRFHRRPKRQPDPLVLDDFPDRTVGAVRLLRHGRHPALLGRGWDGRVVGPRLRDNVRRNRPGVLPPVRGYPRHGLPALRERRPWPPARPRRLPREGAIARQIPPSGSHCAAPVW